MHQETRVTVLISGRGSNLESLLRNQKGYKITDVVTDNPEAGGLRFAKDFGVKSNILNPTDFASRGDFRAALHKTLQILNPEIIALAGFMQIIPKNVVEEFSGRMINIHPSLLPALPGLDTHKRAIEARSRNHGCTVHFVDSGIDTGPIIAQAECSVDDTDTEESLAARVLSWEHKLYPWCLEMLAERQISLQNNSVVISKAAREDANKRGFLFPKESK